MKQATFYTTFEFGVEGNARFPNPQSDQSLNTGLFGLEVLSADNLPSPLLIPPRATRRAE